MNKEMSTVPTPGFSPVSDGVVSLRAPGPADLAALVAGRDEEFDRWLSAETEMSPPLACIIVADRVVGWIDYDIHRSWLQEGEVNVGYFLLAGDRGRGYATRAVELLMRHLADETSYKVATLLIDLRNLRSLAVARRAGFDPAEDIGGGAQYFKRPIGRPTPR